MNEHDEHMGKKRLGQLLCERAYLDEAELGVALAEQKVRHRRLGQILLDLGYVTAAQLNEALSVQAGIERIELATVSIAGEVIGLVPAELVSKYNILPLWREDGRLAVAMTDPFQSQVMEDLRDYRSSAAIIRWRWDNRRSGGGSGVISNGCSSCWKCSSLCQAAQG